jgi:hypothetical protein
MIMKLSSTFDDMIELMFSEWFVEYARMNSANVEDFRDPLKKAFTEGWLKCELFYEDSET